MKTITLNPGERLAAGQLPRQGVLPAAIMQSAQAIVDDVRERGDVALREYCKKFDGVDVDDFRVDPKLMDEAIQAVDPAFIEALKKAAAQIREFHEREVEQSWFTSRADGTILGVKVTPVSAAGVYVPGGRAQYPSTVLMDCIPAKVAGVKRVVMVTPPQKEGGISPYTLAAAKVAGVDEIYAVGGPRPLPLLPMAPILFLRPRKSLALAMRLLPRRRKSSRAMQASTWWRARRKCAFSPMRRPMRPWLLPILWRKPNTTFGHMLPGDLRRCVRGKGAGPFRRAFGRKPARRNHERIACRPGRGRSGGRP